MIKRISTRLRQILERLNMSSIGESLLRSDQRLRVGEDQPGPAARHPQLVVRRSEEAGDDQLPHLPPEKDGLFCERIFGPEKDWECACGKYRGMKYKGMICDRCGVKVTHSRVRRKRMGHIELAAPVVHIWFFKAMPSRLGNLLDMKTTSLEKVIYFQDYVVIDPGRHAAQAAATAHRGRISARPASSTAKARSKPTWAPKPSASCCMELDLVKLSEELREELVETNSKQKKKDLINRLKIVESDPRLATTSPSGWCWT